MWFIFHRYIDLFAADSIKFEDGILMQYTGLKDINGNKIFEGDIVQEVFLDKNKNILKRYGKFIVKFDEERVGYIPFACGDGCGCCETETIPIEFVEMIGNVYENEELLKDSVGGIND